MSKKKQKYYVVWQGNNPGIYEDWEECKRQIIGVSGAQYKSFDLKAEAEAAYKRPYDEVKGKKTTNIPHPVVLSEGMPSPALNSIAVDAACSGNPGVMEYQGVDVSNHKQLFHYKANNGTNNIGEFLGIVHGLSYLKRNNLNLILYSDSAIAINWVRHKECRSKLPLSADTMELWNYIRRAEFWLQNNTYTTEIRKWDTEHWGEIPADFGRKK